MPFSKLIAPALISIGILSCNTTNAHKTGTGYETKAGDASSNKPIGQMFNFKKTFKVGKKPKQICSSTKKNTAAIPQYSCWGLSQSKSQSLTSDHVFEISDIGTNDELEISIYQTDGIQFSELEITNQKDTKAPPFVVLCTSFDSPEIGFLPSDDNHIFDCLFGSNSKIQKNTPK